MYEKVCSWIVTIFIILAAWACLSFVWAVTRYFNNKSKKAEQEYLWQEYKNRLLKDTGVTADTNNRLDLTNDMLDLIVFLIRVEINNVLKTYQALRVPYQSIKLDEDVKIISTNVFEALKKESLSDRNLLVNADYLLKFVTNQTSTLMLSSANEYNTIFKQ